VCGAEEVFFLFKIPKIKEMPRSRVNLDASRREINYSLSFSAEIISTFAGPLPSTTSTVEKRGKHLNARVLQQL